MRVRHNRPHACRGSSVLEVQQTLLALKESFAKAHVCKLLLPSVLLQALCRLNFFRQND